MSFIIGIIIFLIVATGNLDVIMESLIHIFRKIAIWFGASALFYAIHPILGITTSILIGIFFAKH